jgi:hypothetical protein
MEDGRHDVEGLVSGIQLHDDPGPVIAVHATPVGVGEKVRSGPKEDLHRLRVRDGFLVVGNFDQKIWPWLGNPFRVCPWW